MESVSRVAISRSVRYPCQHHADIAKRTHFAQKWRIVRFRLIRYLANEVMTQAAALYSAMSVLDLHLEVT